ncbi:MAG TPA: SAM-dependent methyltransferase [Acidimicrobiia bacterium]|nr:SAM-dependent methyltransferase [Acidimicrobiia bacterium]
MSAAEEIARRIRREGPIPFETFMEHALYEPDGGFFTSGGGAGRAGRDFITSPEVGSLYGACVAESLTRGWREMGEPDPFVVVEAGAGNGRLAADVLRVQPDFASALRYVLVERSPRLRDEQRARLPLEPRDEALGPFVERDDRAEPLPRRGPIVASIPDLPAITFEGIVFANELLDNLPFGIAAFDGTRWNEVRVTVDGDCFVEVLVPLVDDHALPDVGAGARVPIPHALTAWFADLATVLRRGYVLLVDYIVTMDELLARGDDWLRTYRGHGSGNDPLSEPGSSDITGDVVREQLLRAAATAGFTLVAEHTQADWLRGLGIDALVDEGRRAWEEGAARGDLAAVAGRSRVNEAAALTDPAGLGAHRVVLLARSAQSPGFDRMTSFLSY